MLQSIYILIFNLFLLVDPKLITTKVNKMISVGLPVELKKMNQDGIAQRFVTMREPLGAYSTADGLIDFSINLAWSKWPDEDIEMARGFFKASLYNQFDKLNMLTEGTVLRHKRKFVFFEFDYIIYGQKNMNSNPSPITKYVYTQYYVSAKQTLVFTFSCPTSLKDDWQLVAKEIMKTIRIK